MNPIFNYYTFNQQNNCVYLNCVLPKYSNVWVPDANAEVFASIQWLPNII